MSGKLGKWYFLNDRKERILEKIENAMGKKIARDQREPEEGVYIDDVEEITDLS